MANAARKCGYCNGYVRVDDKDAYFDKFKNRYFCNKSEHDNFLRMGNVKTHEKKALKALKSIKRKRWEDKKTEIKGIGHQNQLTQTVVNQYVRLEAKANNRNCISCDKPIDYVTKVMGGTYDAGHYKTVGGHEELRFNFKNINAECKHCNHHDDEHLVGMRLNIVIRFGQDRLDWLDGPHAANHYAIDWHIRCRAILRKKMRKRGWLK